MYIRASEDLFMSKEFHKTIMKGSGLRNMSLKHRTDTNKKTTAPTEISLKSF